MFNSFVLENRYYIHAQIGSGGNANVFLGYDSILNHQVAVKILKHKIDKNSEAYQQYLREIQTICAVSSKNIVKVYDVGIEQDHLFIIMDLVKGKSLRQFIQKRNTISLHENCDILFQICDALIKVHAFNIIHRDIKPQNIMLKNDGQVVLLDFGTAMINNTDATMTSEGNILGSPPYTDPKLFVDKKASIQSDIYSLGITMYELFSGKLPFFVSGNVKQTIYRQLHEKLPNIKTYNDSIPRKFVKIIYKACSLEIEDRYQTMMELKDDLIKAYKKYQKHHPRG